MRISAVFVSIVSLLTGHLVQSSAVIRTTQEQLWNLTEQTDDADKIWLIKQADVFFDMLAIGHFAMAQQEVIVPAMGGMISEIFHSAEWSTAEIRQVARSLERYAERPYKDSAGQEYPGI